jgi:hypothetical protein
MSNKPILEGDFYHDGRGPELQKVRWKSNGVILAGFEYYNPDDEYTPENLKYLSLKGVQVYSMATDEVHANRKATGESKAAIYEVINSDWLKTFYPTHLGKCSHYQIMFYDEIYDVICEDITSGMGKLNA